MSRLFLCLLALGLLGHAVGVSAQEAPSGPSLGSEGEVGAAASLGLWMTWLGGRPLPMYSVAGSLRLTPTVELGGEGVVGFRAVPLAGGILGEESELTFGYGGILLRWQPAGDLPGVRIGGSLLAGAGTARVRLVPAGGTEASENHFILEPRVVASIRQRDRFRVFAAAGYRIAFGAGTLPGVPLSDLRGPTLGVGGQVVVGP
jgi:hypothetical protein